MIGYFMYNENLDWYIFLGATIVLTANIINLQAEKSRKLIENSSDKTLTI